VKETGEAKLIPPGNVGISAQKSQVLEVCMQNHTSAKRMKLSFTTTAGSGWNVAKSVAFDVVPRDKQVRVYQLDLSKVVDWKGTIHQVRLEPGAGEKTTGTMRIDYVRLLERKNQAEKRGNK